MWLLVHVVRGSKHYDPESQVGNRVMISDTTDMVISGRSMGTEGYRFEARKGGESFVLSEFPGAQHTSTLVAKFISLAQQMGALVVSDSS